MFKKLLAGIALILIILFFANYHYGKLYSLDIRLNDYIEIVNTTSAKRTDFLFVDDYIDEFVIRKEKYNITIMNNLAKKPELFIFAKTNAGHHLNANDFILSTNLTCISTKDRNSSDNKNYKVVSFYDCNVDDIKKQSGKITFNVIDVNGEIVGDETIEFVIKQNGYYMTPRGSL